MPLRVIIPVKPFAEAKQRLAPVLAAEERARLAEQLFRHVLATCLRIAEPAMVIVISRAPDVLAIAGLAGAIGVAETSRPDLNAALVQAADLARTSGASKLLIVASDLPFVSHSDLAAMTGRDCAIAPDRHGRGTNALLWPAMPPPGFHFGEGSFECHRTAARAAGFEPHIVSRSGLAYDVDLPADLLPLPF